MSPRFTAVLLLVVTAAGRPGHAASFDCARVTGKREHIICSTPALSDTDTKLGKLYEQKLALLSSSGSALLRGSERSWFAYTQKICQLNDKAPWSSDDQLEASECLASAYTERLRALNQTGRIGPFLVTRVDLYDARPVTDEKDGFGLAPGFTTTHVAYPQIDAAATPSLRAWNSKALRRLDADTIEEGQDTDEDYDFGLVSARLISLSWNSSMYGHGTPHGMFAAKVWNAVLEPHMHDLTPAEVFEIKDGWADRLGKIGLHAIKEGGWSPPDKNVQQAESQIMQEIADPQHWLFTNDGLEITFSAYDGGCYACTPNDGLIPWSKLRPIMAKSPIAP